MSKMVKQIVARCPENKEVKSKVLHISTNSIDI